MATFVIVKKILTLIGILAINEQKSDKFLRPIRLLATILVLLFAALTNGWYFAFNTQTFEQRAEASALVTWVILTQMTFYLIWFYQSAIMGYLEKIQHTAERREAFVILSLTTIKNSNFAGTKKKSCQCSVRVSAHFTGVERFARKVYVEASESVEQISYRTGCFLFYIIIPGYVAPAIVLSYYSYYVMGKPAESAFRLPAPAS